MLLLKGRDWPQLFVLNGKHGSEFFLIRSEDDLWKASLEVLFRRVEEDQYIREPAAIPYALEEGELSKDEIEKLPEVFRKQATDILRRNKQRREDHQHALIEWQNAERALREKDGVLAFTVLWNRKDAEYENFELEDLRIPTGEINF
jgi:hypothetical protein